MELTKVVQLEQDLWAINELDKTTMYLINGTDKVLLIDTGLGISDLKNIIRRLCGEKEVFVVNTHAHEDHDSGNNQFTKTYIGRFDEIYAHEHMSCEKRKIFEQSYLKEACEQGYELSTWNPGPSSEICTVKTGDVFQLGNYTLEVIEIPSHTMGSIALWEEKQGWMFTGDIVLTWQVWGHLTKSVLAPSASLRNYYDSIETLRKYKCKIKTIFPAHGSNTGKLPKGYDQYHMPAEILDIYSEGIQNVLQNKAITEAFTSVFEDGELALFPIGGIVYQKNRMG